MRTAALERYGMVGDLLEPGEWYDGPVVVRGANDTESPPGHRIMFAYRDAVPDVLGQCPYWIYFHDGRIGRCLLQKGHSSWRGGGGTSAGGINHRPYVFSARDSAAMLAGMRRKLEQP